MSADVMLRNREVVRMAQDLEREGYLMYDKEEEVVVGYIYREDGYYTKHYLKNDLDNIARFICSCQNDKLLCSVFDYAIASTIGNFIDLAVNSFLSGILPVIQKYQTGAKVPPYEEISQDGFAVFDLGDMTN